MKMRGLRSRPVSLSDEWNLLEWRSSPGVSSLQHTVVEINPADHKSWLVDRISRAEVFPFFAYEIDESVVAYTRVEPRPNQFLEVSILVSPELRGKGYGYEVLKEFLEQIRVRFPKSYLLAVIHKSNTASLALFKKVGFELHNQKHSNFLELRFAK